MVDLLRSAQSTTALGGGSHEHSFTLTLKTPQALRPEYIDELTRVGCDDALVSLEDDTLRLEFDREAETFSMALSTTVKQVRRVEGFRIQKVNLVGQRDF